MGRKVAKEMWSRGAGYVKESLAAMAERRKTPRHGELRVLLSLGLGVLPARAPGPRSPWAGWEALKLLAGLEALPRGRLFYFKYHRGTSHLPPTPGVRPHALPGSSMSLGHGCAPRVTADGTRASV